MSLLLDALKKAEKAKDEAKRRAQGTSPALDEDETLLHVRTRNELPDISRSMEIHSEDIPGGLQIVGADTSAIDASRSEQANPPAAEASAPADVRHEMRVEPEIVRRPASARAPESAADPQASQRAAAKNVFEAKFKEPNPKLPFYITMAVLSLFAAGTVVYFWYQLRPPPSLINADPKPPADEKKVAVVDTRSPSGTPAGAATAGSVACDSWDCLRKLRSHLPMPRRPRPQPGPSCAPGSNCGLKGCCSPPRSVATPSSRGPRSPARAGAASQSGRSADDPPSSALTGPHPRSTPRSKPLARIQPRRPPDGALKLPGGAARRTFEPGRPSGDGRARSPRKSSGAGCTLLSEATRGKPAGTRMPRRGCSHCVARSPTPCRPSRA